MVHALTNLITEAGWLAPLYYILGFLLTALVPVIPTPLISALGGTAFGFWPAVTYGLVGLGLGAFVALTLARRIGRPLLMLMIRREAWDEWEEIVGIRSLPVWGVVFFLLNLDFVVMLSGLTTLPLRNLWGTAMIARLPWLLFTAWFGSAVLASETVMWLALLALIPGLYFFNRLRPRIRHWLVRLSPAGRDAHAGANPGRVGARLGDRLGDHGGSHGAADGAFHDASATEPQEPAA
ncbi:MAG: VTT domain-containing protein [Trueperaceae bacterium]